VLRVHPRPLQVLVVTFVAFLRIRRMDFLGVLWLPAEILESTQGVSK
jgi:hypothetical protein